MTAINRPQTPATEPLFRVFPDDPDYISRAEAEAAYWNDRVGVADAEPDPGADDTADRHYNRRFTGRENVRWYESLCEFGGFKNGLMLGAGSVEIERRILETNPSLRLSILDISPGALARRDRDLSSRFNGRVTTAQADFNFHLLEPESYDFVVSSSAMHHATNLEHIAYQVQRALTSDGYFFLHDYVGESQRRFSPEKKLVFELLYNRELTRQARPPSRLVFAEDLVHSPFCALRSGEILTVFGNYLQEVEVRTVGALRSLLLYARDVNVRAAARTKWRLGDTPGFRKLARLSGRRSAKTTPQYFSPTYIQHLLDVSDRLTDAEALVPGSAFAIYRKAAPRALAAQSTTSHA